jgi:hypothetical protein
VPVEDGWPITNRGISSNCFQKYTKADKIRIRKNSLFMAGVAGAADKKSLCYAMADLQSPESMTACFCKKLI